MASLGNEGRVASDEPDRVAVAAAVTSLLKDGKARTAREIAASLAHLPGLTDVTKGNVNSVLYSELARNVRRDSEFRWFIPVTSVRAIPAAVETKAMHSDRGSLLRAVQRLRSGTPPSENVRRLTVGSERIGRAIGRWLTPGAPSRWLLISGDYGEGKTHSLTLIRDLAHSVGYATCQLNADASSSALNHPQRFLPVKLGTLELPGTPVSGYEDLLYRILSDRATVPAAARAVEKYLGTGRSADMGAQWAIEHILGMNQNQFGSDEHLRAIRAATFHLTGDSTRYRPGTPATRAGAYALLQVALHLIMQQGARGLVLLLDEVESVFTKLWNARSRFGAYRVMAALGHGEDFPDMKVAFAVTPDAEKCIREELDLNASTIDALSNEPIEAFHSSLATRFADIRCHGLRIEEREQLANRTKSLYDAAYPDSNISSEVWTAFSNEICAQSIPVRQLVRLVVDFLDTQRYGSRSVR